MKVDFFNNSKIKNIKFNIEDFILVETLLDVRQKNASKLSDNEFRKLISYDPNLSEIIDVNDSSLMNYPESYSRWLLKMFNKGELENIEPSDVRNYLKSFTELKNRRTLLPNNDINSYQSIEDLISAINNAKNNLTVNQKNKDAKRNQKQLQGEKQPGMYMNGAVELLFNGKDWEVWTPHTFEGSKALRRGAVWCTGGDNDHYYNSYTKNGTLYVIINKNDNKDKYQLFVPNTQASNNREFKDAQNDTVMFREFVHKNDELLDFFLTREDVTDTYDNLEDPNYDDEWSEEKEDEVRERYDLTYDYNTYEICMEIDYDDLLSDSYYTDPKDYRDYATDSFEYSNDNEKFEQLKKDIIQSEYFVRYNNWSETQLYTLYKFFMKDTKTSYNDLDFQSFLNVLFKTGGYDFPNSPIKKWFDNRHSYWYEKVVNSITETIALDLIRDFIYDSLISIGWKIPKLERGYYSTAYNNNQTRYFEQFENVFLYKFDNCHSIEDFYYTYTDTGNLSKNDIMYEYDINISERRGQIDPDDFDSDYYEKNDMVDDASRILDIFMSVQEYNDFDDSEDEELNESVFYDGTLQSEYNRFNVKIYKNPSKKVLQTLLKKGDVRGYYNEIEMEYYFWEAEDMNHYAFENNFGESGCGFILTPTHILFNEYYLNPEKFTKDEDLIYDAHNYVEMISTDKYITKLYPNGVKIGESY